jgi:hypothetical protein
MRNGVKWPQFMAGVAKEHNGFPGVLMTRREEKEEDKLN